MEATIQIPVQPAQPQPRQTQPKGRQEVTRDKPDAPTFQELLDRANGKQQVQALIQGNGFLNQMLTQMGGEFLSGMEGMSEEDALLAALEQELGEEGASMGAQMLAEMLLAGRPVTIADVSGLLEQNTNIVQQTGANTEQLLTLLTGMMKPQTTEALTAATPSTPEAAMTARLTQESDVLLGDMLVSVQKTLVRAPAEQAPVADELTVRSQFQQAVNQAQQLLNAQPVPKQKQEQDIAPTDIDQLQSKVDANKVLPGMPRGNTPLQGREIIQTEQIPMPDAKELMEQVRTGLEAGRQSGKNEFIIKLKPDGLGEITVKLSEAGSRVALNIITSSAQVQRLITGEMASLREAMRPLGVEVQQVVTHVETQENTHFQAQQQNNFGGHQHNRQQQENAAPQYNDWNGEEGELAPEESLRQSVGSAALDTYI